MSRNRKYNKIPKANFSSTEHKFEVSFVEAFNSASFNYFYIVPTCLNFLQHSTIINLSKLFSICFNFYLTYFQPTSIFSIIPQILSNVRMLSVFAHYLNCFHPFTNFHNLCLSSKTYKNIHLIDVCTRDGHAPNSPMSIDPHRRIYAQICALSAWPSLP